jgi:hypothetical protein
MKNNLKPFIRLLLLLLAVIAAGLLLKDAFSLEYTIRYLAILSLMFFISSAVALVIFFQGMKKEAKEQVMYSLLAIGSKFLIELLMVLLWFVIAKKTSITYIILFFVLYLSFSMFSVITILKTLKKKSL